MLSPVREARGPREYRGSSCIRCHKRKVKCTREQPCRNCTLAKQPCTYVVRDRKVVVAESYLKQLQDAALTPPRPPLPPPLQSPALPAPSGAGRDVAGARAGPAPTSTATSSPHYRPLNAAGSETAEHFMSKLKEIQAIQAPRRTSSYLLGAELSWSAGQGGGDGSGGVGGDVAAGAAAAPPTYEYFALNSDTTHEKCTFKLPPYPYAIHLINRFSIFVGHDWHWFCIRQFRQRLENIYWRADAAEAKDRLWLCQLLVVFSIGASINGMDPRAGPAAGPAAAAAAPGSGAELLTSREFFEQALGLLKIPCEEVSVQHVETLNLMAICSYTLNRQQTAYMYAGMSARMCHMLRLHRAAAAPGGSSAAERENRKRVWWSTFCIDRMASSQMGLFPALQAEQADLGLPSQDGLRDEDTEEFSDADFLTARIQLTLVQADAAERIAKAGGGGPVRDDFVDTVIEPVLQRLEAWKAGLPAHMAFGAPARIFQTLDNMPLLRSSANLRLRYNQCVILLLRPLLLRQITAIFGGGTPAGPPPDPRLQRLNAICLDSARTSLETLVRLQGYGLVARLGFMENMHLFSSLTVLYLAMAINSQRPGSFAPRADDEALYTGGKAVLRDMVAAGSLAGRGHERMLADVEALGQNIMQQGGGGGDDVAGSTTATTTTADDNLPEPWDMDEWMMQLFDSEAPLDLF